jgi:hypothetical protein
VISLEWQPSIRQDNLSTFHSPFLRELWKVPSWKRTSCLRLRFLGGVGGILRTRSNCSSGCLEIPDHSIWEEMAMRDSWRGKNFDTRQAEKLMGSWDRKGTEASGPTPPGESSSAAWGQFQKQSI